MTRHDHAARRRRRATRWRWRNVPLPEPYLGALALSLVAHLAVPFRLGGPSWAGRATGWPLLLAGLSLAGWAVLAAADLDVARPGTLLRRGPYRFSRNPMYLAWALLQAGAGLVAGSAWPLLLLPPALLVTHLVILAEERSLQGRFGDAYRNYRASVRRYL